MSFLDQTHKDFDENKDRWEYAWDHYDGDYANRKVDDYLKQRKQAEPDAAHEERKEVSDPQLLVPMAVESLNGILFSDSEGTKREWGAFGDPEDKTSTAYRLLHNADGKETNWTPLIKQASIKLTVMHKVWVLVDGIKEVAVTDSEGDPLEDGEGNVRTEKVGEARIKVLNPSSVVNWWPSTGTPKQVLVKEHKDTREGLTDTDNSQDAETYVLYTPTGWTRYRKTEEGEEVIDSDSYEFYSDNRREERVLPIFPVEIPMPRDVGYLLAQKQNHIYNFESIRDFSIRNMAAARLILKATLDQYEEAQENLKNGFALLREDPDIQGDGHRYASPPSDWLSAAESVIDKKKEGFMEAAYRSFGDAAKQVTATEIRQESRSGAEAFLTLLVSSVDELENNIFKRLEQIYFPEDTSKWGQAGVERDDDFQPEDVNEAMEQASNTVLNLDRAGAISTFEKVKRANPGWTEEEIEEEVERINNENGAVEVSPEMQGA